VLSAATVTIFDPYGLIGQTELSAPTLPGVVTVTGLADRPQELRVVVAATSRSASLLGGSRVTTIPRQLVTATVTLGDPPDSDHDGVPDDLDDCPTVPDPTQANSAGMGPGNACRGKADLSLPVPIDIASPVPHDLAGADLGPPRDLALPRDLAMPLDMTPGPSLCGSASVILCDGFETGALSSTWGAITVQGGVVVDSTHVYRGSYALHVHQNAVGANTTSATGVAIATLTYPSPDVYMRAWVYLPSPAPTGSFTFLRAQQSVNNQYSLDLDVAKDVFTTYASRIGSGPVSTTAPPLDRWFCVEWQLHLNASGYTIMKLDGNPVTGLQAANTFDTTNSPTYDWLVIGLDTGANANGVPSRDLWLDEIIFDNKPIGCAR
jgi:hypothetical protein